MPRVRITQTLINKSEPRKKRYVHYDDTVPGLILRVEPSGAKIYYAMYTKDGKRSAYKIGSADILTVAQARDAATTFLSKVALGEELPGKHTEFNSVALGAYLEESYFPWVRINRKSGDATIAMLKASFSFLWDVRVKAIDQISIERWRMDQLKSIKPASINRILSALSSALNWGYKRHIINENPLARLERLKERDSQVKVRYLSVEERRRFMKAIDDREKRLRTERDSHNVWLKERGLPALPDLKHIAFCDHIKPMILVSLNTGIRRGALFGLIWGDVDFSNRTLTLRPEEAKNERLHYVPMNDVVFDTLEQWHGQSSNTSASALVFLSSRSGQRFDNCRSAWDALLKAADIQNFRWHDMRHDFASQLVMRGVDLNTVRELLGHADLKMTLRYAHLAPEAKARAVKTLTDPII